jgi:2-hydroxychromene-2-carboxylate isomerase
MVRARGAATPAGPLTLIRAPKADRMNTLAPIEAYLDFSSPYGYLASEWIEELAAQHGRSVNWHAVLLGVVFQSAELRPLMSYPIKSVYSVLDFERSARFDGTPFTMPARFPISTHNAARVFWWLKERDAAEATRWLHHGLRAYFVDGIDLGDTAQLRDLARRFGLEADQAEAVWSDPHWKARLKQANDDAVAAGVFGAPYFIIDGEPFWGNDRRLQIERRLSQGAF